jgi:hypothetical protein
MGGKFTLNGYKHNTIITAKTEFEIIVCEKANFVPFGVRRTPARLQ